MTKDPAVLFYIDTWLSATAEMDSDVRGWYLNLILHNYDKKSLPNDIEKLAVLAGVKFSEFERFKQMYKQVLIQKFEQNESGRLENAYAKKILQGREQFKDKRSRSGSIGAVIKQAKSINGFTDKYLVRLKDELFLMTDENIDKHKDKHLLKHLLKLYINENENENKDLVLLNLNKGENDEIDYRSVHLEFADRLLLNDLECQAIFEVSEKRVTFELLNTFVAHLTNQTKVYNHYSEFKKHFSNWMRKHEPAKENKSKVDAYLENNLAAKKLLGI